MITRLTFVILATILIVGFTACGEPSAVDETIYDYDDETGLIINPDDRRQAEPFIVLGKINSMNLIPTSSPEFVVLTDGGNRFRIESQAINKITYSDGSAVAAKDIQIGMSVRATVTFDPELNEGFGGLLSEDFTIILP